MPSTIGRGFCPRFLIELRPDGLITKDPDHPLHKRDVQQNPSSPCRLAHAEPIESCFCGSVDFLSHFGMGSRLPLEPRHPACEAYFSYETCDDTQGCPTQT